MPQSAGNLYINSTAVKAKQPPNNKICFQSKYEVPNRSQADDLKKGSRISGTSNGDDDEDEQDIYDTISLQRVSVANVENEDNVATSALDNNIENKKFSFSGKKLKCFAVLLVICLATLVFGLVIGIRFEVRDGKDALDREVKELKAAVMDRDELLSALIPNFTYVNGRTDDVIAKLTKDGAERNAKISKLTEDGAERNAKISRSSALIKSLQENIYQVSGRTDDANNAIAKLTRDGTERNATISRFAALITSLQERQRIIPGYHIYLARGGSRGLLYVVHNGVAGTVCDDSWDDKDCRVVCRELGYSSGRTEDTGDNQPYGTGSGQILLDDVECSGNELRLFDCPHNGWGE